MRSPEEVLDIVRGWYYKNWRHWLGNDQTIALSIALGAPAARAIARESDAVGNWMREWRRWHILNQSAQLRRATRKTIVGDQEVFTHLDLATVDDVIALDQDVRNHWSKAGERWERVHDASDVIVESRLRPWLKQIVDLDNADFEILLGAVLWFLDNPRSGLTIRQVPVVGMHTKWLSRHRRLVLACLNLTDKSATGADELKDELEQKDLDVLGLKALPVHIDVILSDPDDRARVGAVRHFRAPQPEISALPIRPDLVVIVENKESAYLLPDLPRTVIIHSLGNHLSALSQIDWLGGARHVYWGDLDRAGITLLSRARARLPRMMSVLMDAETLTRHSLLCVVDETRADAPEANLTSGELAALAALKTSDGQWLRLEQERISESFILERFAQVVDADGAGPRRHNGHLAV